MSRVGNRPIEVAAEVQLTVCESSVAAKGKYGSLEVAVPESLKIQHDVSAKRLLVTRADESRETKALHGLVRSLVANMVTGVRQPWQKKLEIIGVGFQASVFKKELTLNVGFANPIVLTIPDGVICELPDSTHIVVSSADKQLVGQFASDVRAVRPPEPYKGKGIRYADEKVRRKAGKAFGS